mmetsp:Transcript_10763/g.9694  ORF Transcript_10763/g.9694 Transcript_10763/m.9694 type:complete len:368 (-) Transcript_10763:389-1492(-)|eukprot:CAMPEP_0196761692 /NCGR_PEP_ID=MMETSP1095-20130614/997_1 /TAXON_ID=96789 ORGANISM="Chromulina nebulosa, Strain UTEXLB2642" /NCGR_SAMPLE_ID=MMETSP1095 /ASSEMBLY_ACC=CAM_ASM_000446 /LENGTH=367 /DNA_ID=CAMNT_0042111573 /DNA_START=170 /DNA_END=1273 /DNA_ORIENTATION=-
MIDLVYQEAELAFASVSPDVIIKVIAKVLDRLIEINEQARNQSAEIITKFHSLYAPDVSLEQYLQRIKKYANCSISCFVIALIYIDRLIAKQGLAISRLNVHRLLITSVMIAIKFHEDDYYKNTFYAKLGGLSLEPVIGGGGSEINILERELLSYLEFHCMVDTPVFNRYMRELIHWCQTSQSVPPTHSPVSVSPVMIGNYPTTYPTNYSNGSYYMPNGTVPATMFQFARPQTPSYCGYDPVYSRGYYQPSVWSQPTSRQSPVDARHFNRVVGPYAMFEVPNPSFTAPMRDPSPRSVDQLMWTENLNYSIPQHYLGSTKRQFSEGTTPLNSYHNVELCSINPFGAVGQVEVSNKSHSNGNARLRSVY